MAGRPDRGRGDDEQQLHIDGANLIIVSGLVLAPGPLLNRKISALSRDNIPIAVTGGLVVGGLVAVLQKGFDVQNVRDFRLVINDEIPFL
jgi:sodium--glutamate symport carrier gltS